MQFFKACFPMTEFIVMYVCSKGSFGLQRFCIEVRRPEVWLSEGFIQTRRKSLRKMIACI